MEGVALVYVRESAPSKRFFFRKEDTESMKKVHFLLRKFLAAAPCLMVCLLDNLSLVVFDKITHTIMFEKKLLIPGLN